MYVDKDWPCRIAWFCDAVVSANVAARGWVEIAGQAFWVEYDSELDGWTVEGGGIGYWVPRSPASRLARAT